MFCSYIAGYAIVIWRRSEVCASALRVTPELIALKQSKQIIRIKCYFLRIISL